MIFRGRVVKGLRLGRELGFPTANLSCRRRPARGVYAVKTMGRLAVCNVGTRPTVGGAKKVVVEVYIPGFRGNLYGKRLTVEVVKKLRGERKFPSLAALKSQIKRDISATMRL